MYPCYVSFLYRFHSWADSGRQFSPVSIFFFLRSRWLPRDVMSLREILVTSLKSREILVTSVKSRRESLSNKVHVLACKINYCEVTREWIPIRVRPHYVRFVIHNSSKLAFFIHIRLANNANAHIRRICSRLIFVSIGVNSLAIFLTKRTRTR